MGEERHSGDFWRERWTREQHTYVPVALGLCKHNLRALKYLLQRHRISFSRNTPPPGLEPHDYGDYVLEAGGGRGFYSSFYRREGARVVVTDISPWVVEELKKKGFWSVEWDLGEGPIPIPEKFFLVHCTQVLVHLTEPDRFERACYNLAQTVIPGGYLIVGDRFLPDIKINKPHIRYRRVGEYIVRFGKERLNWIESIQSFPENGKLLLFSKEK